MVLSDFLTTVSFKTIIVIIIFSSIVLYYVYKNIMPYLIDTDKEKVTWPPMQQECPDYWTYVNHKNIKYCVNDKSLGNPQIKSLPIVQSNTELAKLMPQHGDKHYYGINSGTSDIMSMISKDDNAICSSYNGCKCKISNAFCVPWSGVVGMKNCKLQCDIPSTESSSDSIQSSSHLTK